MKHKHILFMLPITLCLFANTVFAQANLDVPYVPTPTAVVEEMLKMAKVSKDDFVLDLGSGDGRIVITAATKYGAKGKGIDLNPERVQEGRENAEKAKVANLVKFEQADLFKTRIQDATVVTMYLLTDVNLKLRPRLLKELKPGTRIVSHAFDLGDWKPDEHRQVNAANVYYWVVPAQLPARSMVKIPGLETAVQMNLEQNFQNFSGKARLGNRDLKIEEGRITGENIRFSLADAQVGAASRRFEARVRKGQITDLSEVSTSNSVSQRSQ